MIMVRVWTAALTFSLFFFLAACSSTNTPPPGETKNITSLAPTSSFDPDTIDGVLISVADDVILLSDLQEAILAASEGKTSINASGKLTGAHFSVEKANQILQNLINQKVLSIKASELGLNVTDDELSARINEFLKQQGYTEAQLETQLKHTGKTMAEYRTQFKNEVLKQQVIGRIISPLVNVSNDEVNSYYIQQTKNTKQINSVKLRSLMIQIPQNYRNDPLAYPLIIEIEKKITNGDDFVALVKNYSMAANASVDEGLLSPRPISDLPTQLRAKLTDLKIDEIVGPIFLGDSAFFFQYLGAQLIDGNDLQKNFSFWKNKLLDIKFNERLMDYLKNERTKLKVNERPFTIS
jgi:parvulin-like peptidyl-prolyl isomerase